MMGDGEGQRGAPGNRGKLSPRMFLWCFSFFLLFLYVVFIFLPTMAAEALCIAVVLLAVRPSVSNGIAMVTINEVNVRLVRLVLG